MIQCQVDKSMHTSLKALHTYLRKFKIKTAEYYAEYFPRKDLMTGELIEFKDYDQYFIQEFKNKNNLKKWLKEYPEDGKKWAIDFLRNRKDEKELVYAPSFVELKSLAAPSMSYYDNIGGYYKITEELGFKKRYEDKALKFIPFKNKNIIIDSREQNPIKIKDYNIMVSALNIGDYGLIPEEDMGIYIERKSLNDFCGTLSKGLDRFDKELERAKETDSYIIMVVENNLDGALAFNHLPQMRWVKAQPHFIFKNLRDLLNKYPLNFQVLFFEGRKEFSNKISKIFELGNQVKELDLQFKYWKGEI